jgi:hypothetical protein
VSGFDHLPGFNATGAYAHFFDPSVRNGPDFLQIGVPAGFGLVMGMAYVEAHPGPFTTYFTYFRHCRVSFLCSYRPETGKSGDNEPDNFKKDFYTSFGISRQLFF